MLHEVLQDAFAKPWGSRQLAVLTCTEGAESVAQVSTCAYGVRVSACSGSLFLTGCSDFLFRLAATCLSCLCMLPMYVAYVCLLL